MVWLDSRTRLSQKPTATSARSPASTDMVSAMKLESYVLQNAIYEGRHEEAVRGLLQHFGINLPDAQLNIQAATDSCYGIYVWVSTKYFEWYEGSFFSASSYVRGTPLRAEVVIATVWIRSKNENL